MRVLTNSLLTFSLLIALSLQGFSQNAISIDEFTAEIEKGIPSGFELDESGIDKVNLFAVYKKGSQEIITVNLQKDYQIEFPEQETITVNGHEAIFYYAGFEKSAGLVVFLKEGSGFLVFGYNKPYMGEEIVKKEELTQIVKKLDLTQF